jgi:two-component system, chemotaxis family, chemotaxis protein CheY
MSRAILTVDDSKTMRDMLRLALAGAGHQVTQAEDGLAGVEAMRAAGAVDVIITDINMPRMDGYGFIAEVRRDPINRATPILVLTTESEPAKKQRARDAGATGWIVTQRAHALALLLAHADTPLEAVGVAALISDIPLPEMRRRLSALAPAAIDEAADDSVFWLDDTPPP